MCSKKTRNKSIKSTKKVAIATIISILLFVISLFLLRVFTFGILNLIINLFVFASIIISCSFIGALVYVLLESNRLSKTAIIRNNLSYEFSEVYINTRILKPSAMNVHNQKKYYAKLNVGGTITLRIVSKTKPNDFMEQETSNYDWFLTMFKFKP
jgi:hypothetical protein